MVGLSSTPNTIHATPPPPPPPPPPHTGTHWRALSEPSPMVGLSSTPNTTHATLVLVGELSVSRIQWWAYHPHPTPSMPHTLTLVLIGELSVSRVQWWAYHPHPTPSMPHTLTLVLIGELSVSRVVHATPPHTGSPTHALSL